MGGHPADATQPASAVHTFEAVAGSWGSVSTPAVSRVMSGAPERKKLQKIRRNDIWSEGFCKCCQPQIHWYGT